MFETPGESPMINHGDLIFATDGGVVPTEMAPATANPGVGVACPDKELASPGRAA